MERESLKETILKFFNVDLPISGGYGTSVEDAIGIEVLDSRGAEVENTVIKYMYAFGARKYKLVKKELIQEGGRVYEKLELEVLNAAEQHQSYYFDITQFYGK